MIVIIDGNRRTMMKIYDNKYTWQKPSIEEEKYTQ